MDSIVTIRISEPNLFEDDYLPEDLAQVNIQVQATCISNSETTIENQDDIEVQASYFSSSEATIENEQRDNANECCFFSNLMYWNNEKNFKSVNNFRSSYFDAIVKMGELAVPFIYSELEKGPTPLVFALDSIFKGEVDYNGYVPLEFICKVWLDILKQKKMLSQISF